MSVSALSDDDLSCCELIPLLYFQPIFTGSKGLIAVGHLLKPKRDGNQRFALTLHHVKRAGSLICQVQFTDIGQRERGLPHATIHLLHLRQGIHAEGHPLRGAAHVSDSNEFVIAHGTHTETVFPRGIDKGLRNGDAVLIQVHNPAFPLTQAKNLPLNARPVAPAEAAGVEGCLTCPTGQAIGSVQLHPFHEQAEGARGHAFDVEAAVRLQGAFVAQATRFAQAHRHARAALLHRAADHMPLVYAQRRQGQAVAACCQLQIVIEGGAIGIRHAVGARIQVREAERARPIRLRACHDCFSLHQHEHLPGKGGAAVGMHQPARQGGELDHRLGESVVARCRDIHRPADVSAALRRHL